MPKKEHVSIEDLRRVVRIAEHHSIKEAAKRSGVVNSVVKTSKDMVQQLAAELALEDEQQKNPLFTRGAHLETTFRGERFVKDARLVLRCFNRMVNNMRRTDSPREGEVKIHVSDLLMATVAIPAIAELTRENDYKVAITIRITPAAEAMHALVDHEVDLVVTLSEHHQDYPPLEKKIESLARIASPLVVMATADFRLSKSGPRLSDKPEVSLAELHEAMTPLALPPDSYMVRRLVDSLLGPGRRAEPMLVVNSISHLRHYTRTGCAATILPEVTAVPEAAANGLIIRPLKGADSLHTSFSVYKRKTEKLDPATQLLADGLSKHLLKFDQQSNSSASSPP